MEVESDTYEYSKPCNQGDTHNQSAALSSSFSPDTYNRRAIRKSDKASSSSSSSNKVLDIEFLLCNSCFWCASYYHTPSSDSGIAKCPVCHKYDLESMPLSSGEAYKFDCNPRRGTTLEFSRGPEKEK